MGLVTNADFRTKGHSQYAGMGDILEDIFGKNSTQVTDAAKAALATGFVNITGNLVKQNPDAVNALKSATGSTVSDSLAKAWAEYKLPIVVVASGLTILAGLGLYNTYKRK